MHQLVTQIYAKPQMTEQQLAAFATALGQVVNACISALDIIGGDPDEESAEPSEDDGGAEQAAWIERIDQTTIPLPDRAWCSIGNSEDAEDDDPAEHLLNEDEPAFDKRSRKLWNVFADGPGGGSMLDSDCGEDGA